MPEWVVLVEAADRGTGEAVGHDGVARLLDALDPHGGALYGTERYALQIAVTSDDPAQALSRVLARWAVALGELGLPVWEVVRAEVLTPQELQRDIQTFEGYAVPGGRPPSPGRRGDDTGHELLRQAFSDSLTGLLGPEAFEHRVEASLRRIGPQRRTAVVVLDLDGFARLNERVGRANGDHILLTVANRLGAALRPGDDIARIGSDSYAVLLDDATEDAGVAVAARLLAAVRSPLILDGHELSLSASAGIALAAAGDGQAVVRNADAALAHAKAGGGGAHILFCATMSEPGPVRPVVGSASERTSSRTAWRISP